MGEYGLKFAIYIFEDERYYNILYSDFGIKIIMHTKENGHNLPHVHIQYQDKEAVISLIDGSVLKGNIKKSRYNYARRYVIENREELLRRYNEIIIV